MKASSESERPWATARCWLMQPAASAWSHRTLPLKLLRLLSWSPSSAAAKQDRPYSRNAHHIDCAVERGDLGPRTEEGRVGQSKEPRRERLIATNRGVKLFEVPLGVLSQAHGTKRHIGKRRQITEGSRNFFEPLTAKGLSGLILGRVFSVQSQWSTWAFLDSAHLSMTGTGSNLGRTSPFRADGESSPPPVVRVPTQSSRVCAECSALENRHKAGVT